VATIARDRGCGRFEWAVLDWNEPAIGFYKSLGAAAMDEWTIYRVSGEALERLAGM
jgi:RimJ/RimL family protein N-acetyltransferase